MNRLQFLGTGWSHGVPTLGCDCAVCRERRPGNVRRRASIRLRGPDDLTIVVDVGPDFRDQALAFGIHRLDAVLITHQHADHVMGLDDVRRFTWQREAPLHIHADPSTVERLHLLYPYVADVLTPGKAVPRVHFLPWVDDVSIGPFTFEPFTVPHGGLPCYGLRIHTPGLDIGYVPDCSDLPPHAKAVLAGVDIMILNALRMRPHPSHLTLDRSLELLQELGASRSYLTHMGCPIDYHQVSPTLPQTVHLATDGLEIPLDP